jgi:DNA-binding FadR family transcriptional regulator
MEVKLKPIVTGGMAKQIATNVREAIMAGRLKIDDRLPTEEELATQFGVSRPTIREALKRLTAQNLVRSQRGPTGGTFVVRPTEEQIASSLTGSVMMFISLGGVAPDHLSEARESLERLCCRLAAQHRTEDDLEAMRRQLAMQRDASASDITFCLADMGFHQALVEATHNPLMRILMASLIETLQAVFNMASFPFRVRKKVIAQHEAILEAIVAQDADAAETAMEAQMRYLAETYQKGVQSRQEGKLVDVNYPDRSATTILAGGDGE